MLACCIKEEGGGDLCILEWRIPHVITPALPPSLPSQVVAILIHSQLRLVQMSL